MTYYPVIARPDRSARAMYRPKLISRAVRAAQHRRCTRDKAIGDIASRRNRRDVLFGGTPAGRKNVS
jgi:hypothetical protein